MTDGDHDCEPVGERDSIHDGGRLTSDDVSAVVVNCRECPSIGVNRYVEGEHIGDVQSDGYERPSANCVHTCDYAGCFRKEDVAAAVAGFKIEAISLIETADDRKQRMDIISDLVDKWFPAVGEPDGESDNQELEAATPLIPATTIVNEMDRMERNGVAAAWQKLRNKLRGDTDE